MINQTFFNRLLFLLKGCKQNKIISKLADWQIGRLIEFADM